MTDNTAGKILGFVGLVALILGFWFFVWPGKIWGGVVQYPVAFGGDYDSVGIYWWEKDGLAWDLSDSMSITTFPITDSIALDDAKDYKIVYWYYEGTDSVPSGEFIKFTAGAATVSSTDKEEIANLVEETLKVHHGTDLWTTGTGSGSNNVRYYAIDTTGTNDSLHDVKISVKTIAGANDVSGIYTNANGYVDLTLTSDSLIVSARKNGYLFTSRRVQFTGDDTTYIAGWNIPIDTCPDANYCRVSGYVGGPGRRIAKAKVTFTLEGTPEYNVCDSTFLISIIDPVYSSSHQDSLGYFFADLNYSSCLLTASGDTLQYRVVAEKDGMKSQAVLITVPDSASYKIVW